MTGARREPTPAEVDPPGHRSDGQVEDHPDDGAGIHPAVPPAGHSADQPGVDPADHPEFRLDDHKVAAARLWATNRFPYLASALFAAPVLPAPGLGRLAVDRWWRIHADPVVVASQPVDRLGGELLHLTGHLLRDHAARADAVALTGPAECRHWVDAADAELADDFPADVVRVESSVVAADLDQPDHRLAEEYYLRGRVRSLDGDGEPNDCGSGAHGVARFWEPPPPADERDPGVTGHDQELIRRRVAADIAAHDAEAVAAGLRGWAAATLGPTVDWRRELAAVLRRALTSSAGAVDYSYRRPSRRAGVVPGVVLPSMVRPDTAVAVVCDTSASVSEDMLGRAMVEVDGLLRSVGTRTVTILSCDEAVHTIESFTGTVPSALIGGGGTDMAIGLDAAAALRPTPELIVVLTDGFTPWPATAPGVEVVVALLPPDQDVGLRPPTPPTWTRTVPVVSVPASAPR